MNSTVRAYAQRTCWHLLIGSDRKSQGEPMTFPTLFLLEDHLRTQGIHRFVIDVSALNQQSNDLETMERLREIRQFAELDAVFRRKVREALNDTQPTVPHSVVEEKFAERRAVLLKKLAKA